MSKIYLTSMVDFVKNEHFGFGNEFITSQEFCDKVINYANFISQKLEFWMFVTCDKDGNILEEPKDEELCKYCPLENNKYNSVGSSCEGSKCDIAAENYKIEYQEAKDRILFDGFTVKNGIVFTPENQILVQKTFLEKMAIENIVGLKILLTPNGAKKAGY